MNVPFTVNYINTHLKTLKEAIAYVGHLVDELYNLTDELNG